MILDQSRRAVDLLSKESVEKFLSRKQLVVWNYLKKAEVASTGDIVNKTKVARGTVKQAIEVLLRLKKIERIGLGRSSRYKRL